MEKTSNKTKGYKYYLSKYSLLTIGSIITAIGLELFLIPNDIIDGGVVGLSIMGSYIFSVPLGVFLTIFNLPFLYLGYKNMGPRFAFASVFSILSLSFYSAYLSQFKVFTSTPFLAVVFGGIVTGIGVGIIIRNGGSLDGTEIVAIILDKKTPFSVGEIVMFFNLFILSGAGIVFNWDSAMYSLVAYFVIAKTIDAVIKGLDDSYGAMIITESHDDVTNKLIHDLGRGVTLLYGEGGYSRSERKVLYCVVSRLEIDKLKTTVLSVDENAFVTIYQVNDLIGGHVRKSIKTNK